MTFISELLILISDFNFQNIPFVPPPPPPIGEDGVDGDNEAMCSMLMAWYMSGYHTGYYQVVYNQFSNCAYTKCAYKNFNIQVDLYMQSQICLL